MHAFSQPWHGDKLNLTMWLPTIISTTKTKMLKDKYKWEYQTTHICINQKDIRENDIIRITLICYAPNMNHSSVNVTLYMNAQ